MSVVAQSPVDRIATQAGRFSIRLALLCYLVGYGFALAAQTSVPANADVLPTEQSYGGNFWAQARVCPAAESDQSPPDFGGKECVSISLHSVDPQSRHIWVGLTLELREPALAPSVALLVMAKASSVAYVNGILVGNNGHPSGSPTQEAPGQMDVVFRIPPGLLKLGQNDLALRMSSHRGWLHLGNPIHEVALVPFLNVQDQILRRYLLTLLPLGVFVLASFYFLSITWRSEDKARPALLSALSILATLQLLLEVSRGVFAYPYPLHDLRLMGILLSSMLIGTCLALILATQYLRRWALRWFALTTITLITLASVWVSGMDSKAIAALLIASISALTAALWGLWRGKPQALAHGLALALFCFLNVVGGGIFLDLTMFYLIAALLIFLIAQQAISFAGELQREREQRARIDQLEAELARRQPAPSNMIEKIAELVITVTSVGKMQRVNAREIAHIQGAGDYSELHLLSGQSLLHSIGLNELESELPGYFLRSHRSHIVNTLCVESLRRAEGGSGVLLLRDGTSVPVSRRIMPSVRKALGTS